MPSSPRRRLLRPQPPKPVAVAKSWLDAFVDYAAGECHLSENTVAAYRRDLKHFFAWLDGRRVPDLSIRDLADYVAWLHGRNLAPASIARHIVSLKVFFRYLQLEGGFRTIGPSCWEARNFGSACPRCSASSRSTGFLRPPAGPIPVGAATGRSWSCSMPPAAGRRSFPTSGCKTCASTRPSASAAAREIRSEWCRWVPGRSGRSAPTWNTSGRGWQAAGARPTTGSCCRIAGDGCAESGFGNY